MAATDLLAPFLSAGFYYKTFMWPNAFWEKLYEPMIRVSAGLGRLSMQEDPDCYDKGFLHCELLVIGAGPAGLAAALAAGHSGARVILADEDFLPGGRLNSETLAVNDLAGSVRAYVNGWGVAPGKSVAVFTNNEDGWRTAADLSAKGVQITAVIDTRAIAAPMAIPGASVVMGGRVANARGRKGLRSITLSNGQCIPAECPAVSGGWSPNVHLICRPVWW